MTSVITSDTEDKLEFVTDGAFYFKNNSYYILYNETEEMGMAKCSVTIKVSDNEVTVSRKGEFSSKMLYKNASSSEFLYNTPYGSFPVVLSTEKIKNNLTVLGGVLELIYSMSISGEISSHLMKIAVKPD